MFLNDPRVLFISLHRYDHGTFFPSSTEANYTQVGENAGCGFNVNIPWNKVKIFCFYNFHDNTPYTIILCVYTAWNGR